MIGIKTFSFVRNSNFKLLCITFLVVVFVFSSLSYSMGNAGPKIKVAKGWSKPERLPSPVNSHKWEDGPSISPDGKTIYFTRGRDMKVKSYYSEKTDEAWSKPKELDINIVSFPTGAPHSQDGNTMYFASVRPGVIGLGDIFMATKKEGKWTDIKNLGRVVNTKDMESEPFISADGNILVFASTRKGGNGKTDIWMTSKTNDGWNKPWNVGTPINSMFDDSQPFITSDGMEVYLMSVNRDKIPGPAIFRSVKKDNKWSKPEVVISGFVGEPTLTADKEYLYFVHIILKDGKPVDAEIMFTKRLN